MAVVRNRGSTATSKQEVVSNQGDNGITVTGRTLTLVVAQKHEGRK